MPLGMRYAMLQEGNKSFISRSLAYMGPNLHEVNG